MGVLHPLKIVITNYPEDQEEWMETINNPEDESMGKRMIPFSREIYIERDDFMEDPPRKFFRLAPEREVRLRYAYIIKCEEVIKDDEGNVIELRCTYDKDTKSGGPASGRKVKGTIHWVSAEHALPAEIRIYDRLFLNENPDEAEEGKDFKSNLNPDSLEIKNGFVEPSLKGAKAETRYQFERRGYFCVDSKDSVEGKLVFNRTVALRDSWSKMQKLK